MKRSSTKNTLTGRESEVAALATLGLTCRQIDERLFVSTNTVKTHLHRARAALREAWDREERER